MFSQHLILVYNYAVVSLQIALQAPVKSKGKCKEKRRKKHVFKRIISLKLYK